MIYRLVFIVLSIFVFKTTIAQRNYWDAPTTTALVEINKNQYSAHKNIAAKQTTNVAAANAWNNFTTKVHQLTDSLHERMVRVASVTLDISTTLRAAATVSELGVYQAKTLALVAKRPLVLPYFIQKEKEVIKQANELSALAALFLSNAGMQMNEGARRSCYINYVQRLSILRLLVEHLYWQCKTPESILGQNSGLINNDKQLVNEVIGNAKAILSK